MTEGEMLFKAHAERTRPASESQCSEVPEYVSVRLKITIIARVDALVPSLTPLGSKEIRSNALRALILTGLAVLEAPQAAKSPPGPESAVDAERPANPNAFDGLRESPRHVKSRHVSVRLEPAVIARVDALMPRFIQLGTDPTRSIALRAAILTGLDVLAPRAERSHRPVRMVLRTPRARATNSA